MGFSCLDFDRREVLMHPCSGSILLFCNLVKDRETSCKDINYPEFSWNCPQRWKPPGCDPRQLPSNRRSLVCPGKRSRLVAEGGVRQIEVSVSCTALYACRTLWFGFGVAKLAHSAPGQTRRRSNVCTFAIVFVLN